MAASQLNQELIDVQEKPRKNYTTDEEEDAESSDYSDDLESPTSKTETWTKSPRKEKTSTTEKSALSSRSPSAASSSPPSVSSRSVSVADRGDKAREKAIPRIIILSTHRLDPPYARRRRNFHRSRPERLNIAQWYVCSVHCCAIFFVWVEKI